MAFVLWADGSWYVTYTLGSGRGPCERAYNPATLTVASYCPPIGDGPVIGDIVTGLPSSGIESKPELFFLGIPLRSHGEYARLAALAAGRSPEGTSDVVATDFLDIVADLATGFPLSVDTKGDGTEEGGGQPQSWDMVTLETVDAGIDLTLLVAEIAAKGSVSPIPGSLQYGFTRIEPDQAAQLVDYTPPPILTIDGFTLADLVHGAQSILSGGCSPLAQQILVYTYRGPGMEHITVTSRLMPVVLVQEGEDPLATPADWSDPFRGGMVCDHPNKLVAATTPGGHDLVIDPMSPLHAWGIAGDAVTTVEGNVLPDTLATAVDQVLPPG